MLISIAFYSAVTALSFGIITNTRKVIDCNKRIKKLNELEEILAKL